MLWARGEATAHQVHAALAPTTGLARATIGVLLHRLERRRVLAHRAEGREFWYRPTMAREAVQARRLRGLVDHLFGGDLAAMVSFAVIRGEVGAEDLALLRELVASKEGKRR